MKEKNTKKERRNLAPGALLAPLPAAIVTVGNMERHNALTVAWTGILATIPPRTYVSVRPARHSYGMLKEGGEFVINLASSDMAKEVDFIGIYTGAKMDKLAKLSLDVAPSEVVSAPTVSRCPIAIECRVAQVMPMGSHDVFIGDIVNISCHNDLFDEDGKLHYEKADLLAYSHGEYYKLGECIGRFGFSTDKPKGKARPDERAASQPAGCVSDNKKTVSDNARRPVLKKEGARATDKKSKGYPHGKRFEKRIKEKYGNEG